MSEAADKAVDHVIAFWTRFADQYRAEAEALGLTTEQAADALLSAAFGAKLQVSGPRETSRMLLQLAAMMIQQVPIRDDASAAADHNSGLTKH